MAVKLQPGLEPIPGYKLLEPLGVGGYGAVWKAEAPGGFFKAIKFVTGNLNQQSAKPLPAAQELAALKRILTIRHPFILNLERYDIVKGHLIIVMELADCNLRQRFKEVHAQGHKGVPREELLRYLAEAAEALDFMNVQHQLQHLDIKPANLFLVQNHLKVADFGLVKNEAAIEQRGGGITFDFAAPELWQGGMSRYCDQYSLAICFQELLTGTRPFTGTNAAEWKHAHLDYAPNLAPLPRADQDVIARALAKKPKERWPTCTDLVKALRAADSSAPTKSDVLTAPNIKLPEALTPHSASAVVAVECPHCRAKGKAQVAHQGRAVVCKQCKKPFKVPGPQLLDIPDDIRLAPMPDEPRAAGAAMEILVDARCDKCGHTGYVPEKLAGKKLKCKKCAAIFVVAPGKK